MPTYSYVCDACGHRFDELHSMTADALTTCPECGQDKLRRLISGGAGLIFKGSGFYITDYARKKGGDGDAKTEAKAEVKAKKKDGERTKTAETGKDKKETKSSGEKQ